MSKENLRVVLEKRANDKIEREKQIAIEAKEQERKRILEAQKQEQDIIDRENMRKDKEALAQRKSTVENKVTEEAVETEVIEEAVEIHDFAINFKGTTESAKSVARYAKEVMKITGVLLTRKTK
jgi:ATPase subunit of ABC transporter with duplicated ATPase domains